MIYNFFNRWMLSLTDLRFGIILQQMLLYKYDNEYYIILLLLYFLFSSSEFTHVLDMNE